jgi:hypothetical protein
VADKKRKHSARSERSRNRGNAVAPITRNPAANVPEDAGHTEAIDEFDDLDEIWEASDESALNDEGYRLVNQVGANDFSDFE